MKCCKGHTLMKEFSPWAAKLLVVAFLLRKLKFILWYIWVAIQLNNAESLFILLYIWPCDLSPKIKQLSSLFGIPSHRVWQNGRHFFCLGKGDTWLPKIVYGTQKIKESEDQLYNSFYPSILWIDVFLREVTCCSIHKRQTIREKFTRKDNNILEWKCWVCSALRAFHSRKLFSWVFGIWNVVGLAQTVE